MRTALLVLGMAAAQTAAVAGQELTYAGSLQYSSGSYVFTEPTRTVSLYNGVTLTTGRLRLGGSLPLIFQNTGAVTRVGGAYLPTGGTGHRAVAGRRSGGSVPMGPGGPRPAILQAGAAAEPVADSTVSAPGAYTLSVGDPLLSAALAFHEGAGLLRSLELTAGLKPPLNGLDSGVGTGEWDYALGATLAAAVGPVLGFVDASYWWYGDLPGLELRDGVTWGGGIGFPVSPSVWVSGLVGGSNRVIGTAEAPLALSLGVSYRTSGSATLSLMAGAGLAETSPDFTVSLGLSRALGRGPRGSTAGATRSDPVAPVSP